MEITSSTSSLNSYQPQQQQALPARNPAPAEAQPDRGESTTVSATSESRETATRERQEQGGQSREAAAPQPSYNLQGQKVGSIINITA